MGKVGVYLLVIFSVSNANSLESQPIEVPSHPFYNKHHAHKIQYESTLLKTHGSSQVLVNSPKNEMNGPRISESLVVNYMGNVLDGQVKSDNTPPCGLGQKYKIRYPGSCQKYYECDNGTLVTMSCYWLTNFDVIEQCCRFYYFVDCTITQPPATTSSTVDTTTSIISTSTISNQTTSTNRSTSFASTTPETSTSPVSTTTSKITSASPLTSISSTLRSTTYPIISSSPTSTEIPSTIPFTSTTNPTTTTKSTTIMASTSTSTAPQTSMPHSTVSTSSSQTIPFTVKTSTGAPITETTFFTTDSPISTNTSTLSTSSPTTIISVTTKETDSPTSYPSTTPFPYDPRCSPGQYYKKRFPNDCQKFYLCRNGSLEIWICNTFYNFDGKTLTCRIFWEVDCSIGT